MNEIISHLERIERLTLLSAKPILDIEEAAWFTGYSREYLYQLAFNRRIPHYKCGKMLRFKKSELEEWMTSERIPTENEISAQAAIRIYKSNKTKS